MKTVGKKQTLAVLIDELISGGFQKVAIMEVHTLRQQGYNAKLVVLHKTTTIGYQDLLKKYNISPIYISDRIPPIIRPNFKFPLFSFFSLFHILYPIYIHRFIKKNEFSIFITHGTYTAFSSIAIKNKLNIPYIAFIHDSISYILDTKYKQQKRALGNITWILMPIANWLDIWIVRKAQSVIAFKEMINHLEKIIDNYKNFHPINNGCQIHDLNTKRNKEFAIAVTKWDGGKNFNLLINVWKQLTNKPKKLLIIGTYKPKEVIKIHQQAITQNLLDNEVEIKGEISEMELNNYYRNAYFLIHPCKEAFGMTILEAASHGCPSIFTRNSGVAMLFNKDENILMVNENDTHDYLSKIASLMTMPTSSYTKTCKGYHDIANVNSWAEHCKTITRLIESHNE